MKKSIGPWLIGACATLIGIHGASAQEAAPAPLPLVEIFGCNFKGNNDMDDLLGVTARWNTWADRHNVNSYTALILTPYFHSDQLTYDALWLGAYTNGAAMGAGEATWFAEGGDIQAAFDGVADCPTHSQFAAYLVRTPAAPPSPSGLVTFEDCALHDGRVVAEAIAAGQQWTEYLAGMGSDLFAAMLFPLAGESPDADYNFKVVTGFSSVEAYGQFLDVYTGGGFRRSDELFGRLLDCNSARVYTTNRVRASAAN